MSKKVLALLMALMMILAFSLTGCQPKAPATTEASTEAATEAPATAEPVTVDIFQFKVEIVDALNEAAALYAKENPNVTINVQTVGGGDDYGAALRAQFQSGSEPDIYNIGGPQDVKDWSGKLEDLSGQPWVSQTLDGVLSGVTVDGKVFGLPYAIEGYGLAYNKAIFEAAGIDAAAIKDFATLEAALMGLQAKIEKGELKDKFPLLETAVEYSAKETWVTGLHSSNMAFSNEFASSLDAFAATKIDFKYQEGFKAYIDLLANASKYAKDKSKLNVVDYATSVDEGIAIERAAVIQQGNWIYGGVKAIDPLVADKLGFLPMPLKGVKEDSIAIGVPMYWAVNSGSPDAEKAAGEAFLNWLYTSDAGKDIVVNKMFFIPPMKGYDAVQPADPLAKDILRYAGEGRTMPWVFMGYPTDFGMGALGNEIQKYFAGEETWEQLVENSKTKWTEMR